MQVFLKKEVGVEDEIRFQPIKTSDYFRQIYIKNINFGQRNTNKCNQLFFSILYRI